MVRSVWSGSLSFGLVSIPVRLVPATEPKDVRFHLVDPETGRRVRYRRFVESDVGSDVTHPEADPREAGREEDELAAEAGPDGAERIGGAERSGEAGRAGQDERADGTAQGEVEVDFASLARGVEVEPGVMVTLTQDEIRAARPTPSRTIEIEDFVELAAIDPVYFEKSYVVAPQFGGTAERPYALLLRALERSGRVGIGRFVLRTKPHLVAVRPRAGALGLETLFFGDEVRAPETILAGAAAPSIGDRELAMAEQLIGMLAAEWDPSRYADTYREELLELIAGKAPSVTAGPEPAPARGTSDAERLMDALRASVERAKAGNSGSRRSRTG